MIEPPSCLYRGAFCFGVELLCARGGQQRAILSSPKADIWLPLEWGQISPNASLCLVGYLGAGQYELKITLDVLENQADLKWV
jgi:hypothetical protein